MENCEKLIKWSDEEISLFLSLLLLLSGKAILKVEVKFQISLLWTLVGNF